MVEKRGEIPAVTVPPREEAHDVAVRLRARSGGARGILRRAVPSRPAQHPEEADWPRTGTRRARSPRKLADEPTSSPENSLRPGPAPGKIHCPAGHAAGQGLQADRGRLAQRLERLPYKQEVIRSNRISPTTCVPGGGVAQLDRAPDCRSGGCGFESRRSRHILH